MRINWKLIILLALEYEVVSNNVEDAHTYEIDYNDNDHKDDDDDDEDEYRGSPEEDVATNELVDNLALGGDALRQQNTDL